MKKKFNSERKLAQVFGGQRRQRHPRWGQTIVIQGEQTTVHEVCKVTAFKCPMRIIPGGITLVRIQMSPNNMNCIKATLTFLFLLASAQRGPEVITVLQVLLLLGSPQKYF